MKKPSTQIRDIIAANLHDDGSAHLGAEDVTTIMKLTKSIDRRDQQLRKPRKKAAKKAAK